MAGGLQVPRVPPRGGPRAADSAAVALSGLRARHLGHGGDGPAPDQGPTHAVVLGGLPGLDSDPWLLGSPAPAPARTPAVRDGLGHAAEASARHGSAGA